MTLSSASAEPDSKKPMVVTVQAEGFEYLLQFTEQARAGYIMYLLRTKGDHCGGVNGHWFLGLDENQRPHWMLQCDYYRFWSVSVDPSGLWTMKRFARTMELTGDDMQWLHGNENFREPTYKTLLKRPDEYIRRHFSLVNRQHAIAGCYTVVRQKFLGERKGERSGAWIAECLNGNRYIFHVLDDDIGTTSGLPCHIVVSKPELCKEF